MKNHLTESLKEISYSYFFNEKILICPSFGEGYQFLENFTKAGSNWINYKISTIQSLAEGFAQEKIFKDKLKIASMTETVFLIDRIFTESAVNKTLKYFKKHTLNTGIINAISSSLLELKFEGVSFSQILDRYFIDPEKAHDLRQIYEKYEARLKEKSLIDTADLIVLSTKILPKYQDDKVYITLEKHDYRKIEKDFLISCCPGKHIVIGQEKVFNLLKPKNRLEPSCLAGVKGRTLNEPAGNIFSYLFDMDRLQDKITAPAAKKENTEIELFCAQNYRDEIYSILSRLADLKVTIDDAEIIYTSANPYLGIIYDLCHKLQIPLSVSAGLPGDKSKCGKALEGFLLWIKEDFHEVYLRNLFKYDLLKINSPFSASKPGKPGLRSSGPVYAHALRISKIGWGRERYIPVLKKNIEDIQARSEKNKKIPACNNERISILENLKDYVTKLLSIIPQFNNGKVDFVSFCNCCLVFLSDFLGSKDEREAMFISGLKQRLKTLELVAGNEVYVEEAVEKISNLIRGTRFLRTGPKPGHLFVSGLKSAGLSGRRNTFIVGMDDHKFPGTDLQDPILLDEEREKISKGLLLSKDILKDKVYDFTAMLASIRGTITFSYSVFDIKDEKKLFAASFLLQIYRLKKLRADADYNDLLMHLGQPDGYGQDSKGLLAVDENYRWIDKLVSGRRLKNAKESILNIYPGLSNGTNALSCRNGIRLTCFDGFIGYPGKRTIKELDPRVNSKFILSCTGIEKYAQSPFAFFLENILKIKRPEEIKKDMATWLDAKARGSLLHEVFQEFTGRIINMAGSCGDYPDTSQQLKIIRSILDNVIEKYRQEAPFPGKSVFDREVMQLSKDIEVFIDVNESLGNPCFTEYEFGYNGKDPAKISLGKDSSGKETYIYLAGRIDRVDFDLRNINEYHVWDYKTGSSYGYEEDGFVFKGRHMQHVLYAKAMEGILKNKNQGACVTKCGYIFPTQKGMESGAGHILVKDPGRENEWMDALKYIIELISAGVFIISDEANPSYLDDEDMYGSPAGKKSIREKIKNPENAELEKWILLKKIK